MDSKRVLAALDVLNAELADSNEVDPDARAALARVTEDIRQHLIGSIGRHQCDVKYALERRGSPYSLVLTKTTGSFERAVKRLEANRRLLSALPRTN